MKVRELIERLQTMEQDATVTVRIEKPEIIFRRRPYTTDEVRIDGIQQYGSGFHATVRLEPEDNLKLS